MKILGRILFALAVGTLTVLVIRYTDQSITYCIQNGGC
jgi:hypothetical protein